MYICLFWFSTANNVRVLITLGRNICKRVDCSLCLFLAIEKYFSQSAVAWFNLYRRVFFHRVQSLDLIFSEVYFSQSAVPWFNLYPRCLQHRSCLQIARLLLLGNFFPSVLSFQQLPCSKPSASSFQRSVEPTANTQLCHYACSHIHFQAWAFSPQNRRFISPRNAAGLWGKHTLIALCDRSRFYLGTELIQTTQ